MANCPVCTSHKLTPTTIIDELFGLGCPDCGGILLSLVNYRVWREMHRSDDSQTTPPQPTSPKRDNNTQNACQCPKCGGVMSKYHFSIDSNAQLDFCFHCEEIWFDRGEWALLSGLALTDELTQIFTHPWQHALVKDKIAHAQTQRWEQRFGDDYQKIADTFEWIQHHPQKSLIIAYINDAVRHSD